MDEIAFGIFIPADDPREAINILNDLVDQGIIEELRGETDNIDDTDDYFVLDILTQGDIVATEYKTRPRYPDDIGEKGLMLHSGTRYNQVYPLHEFRGIKTSIEVFADLAEEIEEKTSIEADLFIDRVST